MIGWITIIGIIAVASGAPLDDDTATNVTEPAVEITTVSSITNDVEGFTIIGEILPSGSEELVKSIIFRNVPEHTETKLGSSVLLPCRTTDAVAECQWSWQPFPPTNLPIPDTNEHPPPLNASSATVLNVTMSPTISRSIPVRLFPAFGNESNDCSVRFSSAKYEQTGFWICAARRKSGDTFTATEPAKLTIANGKNESTVTFAKSETAVEATVGSPAQLICKTKIPVKECMWSWRQLNQSAEWNLEVKKFPAFGNESTDCSLKFNNVLPEQEGLWTCGAQASDLFVQTSSIRFLISEVQFVQLSRGIQIAAGESAFLRCLVNKPVVQCEWSWRSTNDSKDANVTRKFVPNADAEHDCSVRFKNVLHEEEGLWTCGVRLSSKGLLHEAPPATVTLLPSAKIDFVESPVNTLAQVGTKVTLKCVTSGRVDQCTWMRRSLNGNPESKVIEEFPSSGELGRDCSLNIPRVTAEEQGFWSCQVSIASLSTTFTSSTGKLTVYAQDAVKFSELSKDIQISSGGSVLLRCVTTSAVEQCRWSLTQVNLNTTVVVKQFTAAGDEARDCSVRLSHALAEQEGLWTCGAKAHGQANYTDAPSTKLSLLEPEPVLVALWSQPHQKVMLACKAQSLPPDAKCEWIHDPDVRIGQDDNTFKERRNLQLNISTGICSLQFNPTPSDLGPWICKFTLKTEKGQVDLGNSSIILINATVENSRLGWIVGSVTSIILLLMILAVTLVVCRGRLFTRRPLPILETASAGNKKNATHKVKKDKNASDSGVMENLNIVFRKEPHFYDNVMSNHEESAKM